MSKKYYYHNLESLPDDIFIKKVAHFLMELENRFGECVPIDELRKKYGDDYTRIIRYLQSGKSSTDHLISGNEDCWTINNWNFNKVQELITRVIQEDSILKQVEIMKQTRNVYIIMTLATITMAIATFMIAIKGK